MSIAKPFKSEIFETISIGMPLIAAQLIYACSSFIGTAMVARLGQEALASSVLVSMIWLSLSVFFFSMLNAISVFVSHQYGASFGASLTQTKVIYHRISEIMGAAILIGIVIIIIMMMILLSIPFFLPYTGQSPIVINQAIAYMHALLFTIPTFVLLIIIEQFFMGVNLSRLVLKISLLIVPLEIPLMYVLIFGKFGFPKLGVAGIGYGLMLTYTITFFLVLIYLLRNHSLKKFKIFSNISFKQFHWLKELWVLGLPMGLMHLIEVGAFTLATFWIARFGTTMLAAHQIAIQYLSFALTIVFAMSQAVSVRVATAFGEKNLAKIRYAIFIGMILSFIAVLIIVLGFLIVPELFLSIDLNIHGQENRSLIKDATNLLAVGGLLMLFDNFRIIGTGALRGLKDAKVPMLISLFCFWLIGMGSAYYFSEVLNLQYIGVWWGLTLGIAFAALLILLRLQWMITQVAKFLT